MITLIKESTEKRGEILVQAIEGYKEKNGYYPLDLNNPVLKDAPKSASIFRRFYHEIYTGKKNEPPYFSI